MGASASGPSSEVARSLEAARRRWWRPLWRSRRKEQPTDATGDARARDVVSQDLEHSIVADADGREDEKLPSLIITINLHCSHATSTAPSLPPSPFWDQSRYCYCGVSCRGGGVKVLTLPSSPVRAAILRVRNLNARKRRYYTVILAFSTLVTRVNILRCDLFGWGGMAAARGTGVVQLQHLKWEGFISVSSLLMSAYVMLRKHQTSR